MALRLLRPGWLEALVHFFDRIEIRNVKRKAKK